MTQKKSYPLKRIRVSPAAADKCRIINSDSARAGKSVLRLRADLIETYLVSGLYFCAYFLRFNTALFVSPVIAVLQGKLSIFPDTESDIGMIMGKYGISVQIGGL